MEKSKIISDDERSIEELIKELTDLKNLSELGSPFTQEQSARIIVLNILLQTRERVLETEK